MKRCADELGGPDILVNNAGIQHVSPVEDFPPEKWDAIIAINLSAAFHTTRLAVPGDEAEGLGPDHQHRERAQPRRLAQQVAPMSPPSTASPASPRRSRWRPRTSGITVNCISPGYVWTPLVENADPRHDEGARPDPRAGDERRAARRPADQALRHARGGRRARALPVPRGSARRSPAPTSASTAAGPPPKLRARCASRSLPRSLLASSPARRLQRRFEQPAGMIPRWTTDWRRGRDRGRPRRGCATGAQTFDGRARRGAQVRPWRGDRPRRRAARSRCGARRPADPQRHLPLPGDQARRQASRATSTTSLIPASPAGSAPSSRPAASGQAERLAALCRPRSFPTMRCARSSSARLCSATRPRALQYGQDETRDVAGYVERIGPDRWRLVMPKPHFESQLDVMELVPMPTGAR